MWKRLTLILLAGAALRGLFLWLRLLRLPFLETPAGDAHAWLVQARSWLANGPPDAPWFDPPGYTALLAALLGAGGGPVAVALLQLLLGSLTVLLLALLAERLFGRREAILAAILMTLAQAPSFYEGQLLEATLSAGLATAALLLLALADRGQPVPMSAAEEREFRRAAADGARPAPPARGALGAALGGGALLGLLAVVQPGYLAGGLLVLVVLLARTIAGRRHWRTVPAVGLGLLLGLSPVLVVNGSHGVPTAWPTGAGVRFWQAARPGGSGLPAPEPPEFSGSRLALESEADSVVVSLLGRSLEPGPELGYWTAAGLSRIVTHLPAWLELTGRKLRILAGRHEEEPGASLPLELDRIPHRRLAPLPANFFVMAGLVGLLLAAGAAGAPRGARGSLLGIAGLLVAALLAGVFSWPVGRIRFAVLPVLALLAAHALIRADDAWRGGRRWPVAALLAAGLAGVALTWESPAGGWRRPAHEASLYVEAGSQHEAAGAVDRARSLFEEALRLEPTDRDARLHLSQLALRERDLAGAIAHLEAARAGSPDDFSVRNNLGILYLQALRHGEADREMQAACRLDPEAAGPWYYRGNLARVTGDSLAAIGYYRMALERDNRFAGAWIRMIDLLLDLGMREEARREADRATEAAVALPDLLVRRLQSG